MERTAEQYTYLCQTKERETVSFLTTFLFRLGEAMRFIDDQKAVQDGSKLKGFYPLSLPAKQIGYKWQLGYGCVSILFRFHPDFRDPSDKAFNLNSILGHFRENDLQVFGRDEDDFYPIVAIENLTIGIERMIESFLRGIRRENSYRRCSAGVICTTDRLHLVKQVGDKWLCDSCLDCYSLSASSEQRELNKPKSSAEIERAKLSVKLRFSVLERDGFACKACGRSPRKDDPIKLHVDHVLAVAKGGKTIPENLQTLCQDCNLGKSDRNVEQMLFSLA